VRRHVLLDWNGFRTQTRHAQKAREMQDIVLMMHHPALVLSVTHLFTKSAREAMQEDASFPVGSQAKHTIPDKWQGC